MDSLVEMSHGEKAKEECMMEHVGHATQMGVEAAIAKNEVAHLNSKRIQDEVRDLKEEEEMGMIYPGHCGDGFGAGGMGMGLMFGLLASGGLGWGRGGFGHGGCGDGCGRGCHDTIEILRDNHDGVLALEKDINCNAREEAEARHRDAMMFQKELDRNELKIVEVGCKLEKDMFCGFEKLNEKLCCIEKEGLKDKIDTLRCKLNKAEEKEEELREIIRDNKQTQTLLDAIAAITTAAAA